MTRRWHRLLLLTGLALPAACGGAVHEAADEARALERYGIRITVPDGWHARLTRATVEAATLPVASARPRPALGEDDIVVRIFEFEPDPAYYSTAELERGYAEGPPRAFTADEFRPPDFSGENAGDHGFARRNFVVAGRYFDLFAESGRAKPTAGAVSQLNDLLASLQVSAGDFYPGTIRPPRFPATPGWHVGSGDGGEVRASDYAEAWASTVPYRNGPRDLPPARTLETLPDDGILIWVGLARDNRYPPTSEVRRGVPRVELPLDLRRMQGGIGWEGQVRDISLYRLHGLADDRFHVDAWVFFGGGEPTGEQRALAQAMLDRLEIPDWGRWELDGRGDSVSTSSSSPRS